MHLVNGNYWAHTPFNNFLVMSLLLIQRLCQYAMDQYIISNCLLFSNHISKRALNHGEKFHNLQKIANTAVVWL